MSVERIELRGHLDKCKEELKSPSFYRDVAGEVLSSFYLMSVQCSIVLAWGDPTVKGSMTGAYLAIGCAIFVLIEAFGQYGGAFMNPAVTIAFLADGRITIFRTLCYIPAQLLGVSGGAFLIYFLVPEKYRETLAATVVQPDMTPVQGFVAEIWLTAFLVTIVFASMNEARRPVYMNSLAVGMWVFVASVAGARMCGASMNPARSFGPAIAMNIWTDHWVYWAGPITGALLATFWTKLFFDRIGHPSRVAAVEDSKDKDNSIEVKKKMSRSKESVGRPELEGLLEEKPMSSNNQIVA